MRKNLFLAMAVLCACTMFGADEKMLIRNAGFAKLNSGGIPIDWVAPGPMGSCSVRQEDGTSVLVLNRVALDKPAMLIQRDLPLTGGKKYLFNCEVKGNAGAIFMFYCEWQEKNAEGKIIHRSVNARTQEASEEWQNCAFELSLPESAQSPYIVIAMKSGAASFRNLTCRNE